MDIQVLIGSVVRHLTQMASGALVASGVLLPGQTDSFVEIIGGAVVFVVVTAWSYFSRKKLKAAPAA